MEAKTADLCDQYLDKLRVVKPGFFKSYGKKKSFSGTVATVRVAENNVLVQKALEELPANTVLVVDGMGSENGALVGGNLAAIGEKRGLAGVIVHGCVRDLTELMDTDIGVLAVANTPVRSHKEGIGEEDVVVEFGGVKWQPGDFVYADEDGVVIASEKLN